MLGLKSFKTARRTLVGIEIINAVRKGQVKGLKKRDILFEVEFINSVFKIVS